jgi:hypothetical protein
MRLVHGEFGRITPSYVLLCRGKVLGFVYMHGCGDGVVGWKDYCGKMAFKNSKTLSIEICSMWVFMSHHPIN